MLSVTDKSDSWVSSGSKKMFVESNIVAVQWVINITFNTLQNESTLLGLQLSCCLGPSNLADSEALEWVSGWMVSTMEDEGHLDPSALLPLLQSSNYHWEARWYEGKTIKNIPRLYLLLLQLLWPEKKSSGTTTEREVVTHGKCTWGSRLTMALLLQFSFSLHH